MTTRDNHQERAPDDLNQNRLNLIGFESYVDG